MAVRVCAIAAMSENRVIGRDGGLPWHVPEDLKFFKAQTLGKPVVMGRLTFDSIGRKPLPGRTNIVVSRASSEAPFSPARNPIFVADVDEAIALAKSIAAETSQNEAMVLGGAQIYRAALPLTDRIYLTVIHRSVEGDTFFPALDEKEWRETARDDRDGFSFLTLDRVAPGPASA